VIALLWMSVAWAAPADALDKANSAYLAGEYSEAVEGYSSLVELGHATGDLYYNLGNALYRNADPASALLAWKRAEWLSPRDGDILANLERVRSQSVDNLDLDSGPRLFFLRRTLSVGEQGWIAGWLLALVGGLVLARRLRPGLEVGIPMLLLGAPGVLLSISAVRGHLQFVAHMPGVVLAESVEARSAGGAGVSLFELHQGAEVEIHEKVGEVSLISLSDERRGWVPNTVLGVVDPASPFPR
jgi:tetratricopeptide (TPR) repeat protein